MSEANVLVCPLWEQRDQRMECRKISCGDCNADISMHPANARCITRGFAPICVQCFVRRALAAAHAGERVALLDSPEVRPS
jgi:hypothetical protein